MTDTTTQSARALPPNAAPPERIDVDEFHLRRFTLEDALAVNEAVEASYAEIHPWMPWCVAPIKIEDQREFIEGTFKNWATGAAFNFGIFDIMGALIGTISLMDRVGPGGLEIGYWLRTDASGRGVMTRAVDELTEIGLGLPGISRIEIHCDEANLRSAAVPKRLGYRLDRIDDDTIEAPGETGRGMVWITP